ncbi:E3 ubiquitin-protein ligase BRE1-like [Magnolia sinica]|uniref:E3 ubiquitin-protein ligase BRE1-like n=1 Tax=Magnolia sinica TaxID=86752 RepID=UPI00265A0E95|nr:E3 ubiquitin-protein ligase BRE1-like [Magnolia sinica]
MRDALQVVLALKLQPRVEEAETEVVRSITDDIYRKDKASWAAPTIGKMVEDMVLRHVTSRKLKSGSCVNENEEFEEIKNKLEADLKASLETLVRKIFKPNKKSRSEIKEFNQQIVPITNEVEGIKDEVKRIDKFGGEIKQLKEENASLCEEVNSITTTITVDDVMSHPKRFEDGMSYLKDVNASLREQMKQLINEFQAIKEKVPSMSPLGGENASLQEQMKKLGEEFQAMKDNIPSMSPLREENASLREQIKQLGEEIQEMKRESIGVDGDSVNGGNSSISSKFIDTEQFQREEGSMQRKVEVLSDLRHLLSKSEVPLIEAAFKAGAIPVLVQHLSFGSPDEQVQKFLVFVVVVYSYCLKQPGVWLT